MTSQRKQALEEILTLLQDLPPHDDLTAGDLVEVIDLFRDVKIELDAARGSTEKALEERLPGFGTHMVNGREVVVSSTSRTSKKADHKALLARLVAIASDERQIDFETGEALEREVDAFVRVFNDVYGLPPSVTPKVAGMADYGLEYDIYVDVQTTPGTKVTVKS